MEKSIIYEAATNCCDVQIARWITIAVITIAGCTALVLCTMFAFQTLRLYLGNKHTLEKMEKDEQLKEAEYNNIEKPRKEAEKTK